MVIRKLLVKLEPIGKKIYAFLEKAWGIILILLTAGLFYTAYKSLTEEEAALKERGVKAIATVYKLGYYKRDKISFYYQVKGIGYRFTVGAHIEDKEVFPSGFGIGYQYEVTYLPDNPQINDIDFTKRIYPKDGKEWKRIVRLVDSLNGRTEVHIQVKSKLPDGRHLYDSVMSVSDDPFKKRHQN